MHLLNTNALVLKIRNNELSQTDRFKYFFISTVLTSVCIEMVSYSDTASSTLAILNSTLLVLIAIIGLLVVYRANKSGDNKDFIDRYICISLPVGVKVFAATIGIYAIYHGFGYFFLDEAFDQYLDDFTWVDLIISIVFEIVFFWRMLHHIKLVSGEQIDQQEFEYPLKKGTSKKTRLFILFLFAGITFFITHLIARELGLDSGVSTVAKFGSAVVVLIIGDRFYFRRS